MVFAAVNANVFVSFVYFYLMQYTLIAIIHIDFPVCTQQLVHSLPKV